MIVPFSLMNLLMLIIAVLAVLMLAVFVYSLVVWFNRRRTWRQREEEEIQLLSVELQFDIRELLLKFDRGDWSVVIDILLTAKRHGELRTAVRILRCEPPATS